MIDMRAIADDSLRVVCLTDWKEERKMESKVYPYAAVLIFESLFPNGECRTSYEEEIVLIEAPSRETARERAKAHGKASEHRYQNKDGETIETKFKQLVSIQRMDEPTAGSTLYSRSFTDYAAYEKFEPMLKGEAM